MAAPSASAAPSWDVWVRLFHWSLALAVGFQLLSGLTGFEFYEWHNRVGEIVLALVVFRLLWGLVGSAEARLSDLVSGPRAVLAHFRHLLRREVPPERGHNAAGGWAVIAMLAIVGTQALTGLFIADEDEFIEGALYGAVSGDTADLLYRVHRINANFLQAIVVLHVAMIALYWLWGRRNLVVPMITGRMAGAPMAEASGAALGGGGVASGTRTALFVKGLACALVTVAAVGLSVGWF